MFIEDEVLLLFKVLLFDIPIIGIQVFLYSVGLYGGMIFVHKTFPIYSVLDSEDKSSAVAVPAYSGRKM